ncbi:MAG: hypothetical protein HY069_03115 [Chlamydiia bacterium]|nr:hypothetical protein [Chlamydiia bacterium]
MNRTAGWAISNSLDMHYANSAREYSVEEFLSQQPAATAAVDRLSQAAILVRDAFGRFIGNGVAIAPTLVLTVGHCVNNNDERVIFDGACTSSHDFKVIHCPTERFVSVPLTVTPGVGESVQLYFKEDQRQYAKLFVSEQNRQASRSDRALVPTYPGESGAPRMSLHSGAVHAIHQGESEGLKVLDIYTALSQAVYNPEDPQTQSAQFILNQMNVLDKEMAAFYWAPVELKIGAVQEEKPGVKGELYLHGRKGRGEKPFRYFEECETGSGPRKLTISKDGTHARVTYAISPNPHKDSTYNKKQEEFYRHLATALAQQYEATGNFPGQGTIRVFGVEYTLTP